MKLPMPGAAAPVFASMSAARAAPGHAPRIGQAATGRASIRPHRLSGAGRLARCLNAEG